MGSEKLDPVQQIADAVLYEGYLLWPYRRSALKNRQRWTFGGVFPRSHHEVHEDDRAEMRAECLVKDAKDAASVPDLSEDAKDAASVPDLSEDAKDPASVPDRLGHNDDAVLGVSVRFLHIVRRQVANIGAAGREPVEELTVAGERYLSWEEATERTISAEVSIVHERSLRVPIDIPAGSEEEELRDADGQLAGVIVRSWKGLEGTLELAVEHLKPGLHRLSMVVANETPWSGSSREEALERSFCSSHAVLRTGGGDEFVSLTDPPDEFREEAEACRNEGVWPVLVGEPEDRHTLLASPIILEDHPKIAPESPGDLFDGGEIDQLLILNILSMTDEEKAEMRQSDPKAREILDRSEALSNDELMALHGAIREFQYVRP